jgi:phosphoglycerate dehydrogenase-like enzyme
MSTKLQFLLTFPEKIRHQYLSGVREAFPNLEIQMADHYSKVTPFIEEAEVLLTFGPMMSEEVLQNAKRLKWVQALGSGVDGILDRPSLRSDVLITNMYGIHGVPVSEAALMSMLALARNVSWSIKNQIEKKWNRSIAPSVLHGKTVVILGIGIIASALAPKCQALGMNVIGVSSAVRAVEGFNQILPKEQLHQAVKAADYLVLLTPYSVQTHHLVNQGVLTNMKKSAFLINLARGGVVDEAALLNSLQNKQIAGAALDVFQEEPLPSEHPFWSMDNVLVTPHLGGFYDEYVDHALPILIHNIQQYLKNDFSAMKNIVRLPQ